MPEVEDKLKNQMGDFAPEQSYRRLLVGSRQMIVTLG